MSNNTQENLNVVTIDLFSAILLLIIKFLCIYGFQWIILTKLSVAPFTMAETVIFYAGLYSLTTIFK